MKDVPLENYVLAIVCSVFDAYSAALFLPSDDGSHYYLAASFSLGQNIPKDAVITPGKGVVGWIVEHREPLIVTGFDHKKNSLGYYEEGAEEGIKAFMGYPIPTGGALCVDSKRQYSFSEKDYKLLQLFAELLARQQSLGKQTISEDIPRYFAELGVIQDLRFRYKRWPVFLENFLRAMSDATLFDYCALATRPEGADFYTIESESAPLLLHEGQSLKVPLGSGVTGWVFTNEQPVYAEEGGLAPGSGLFGKLADLPDFPAAICLPVFVNRGCRGVLCLANTEPRKIDESMRNFARQAVDHLSMFLENLYLRNRLRSFFPKTSVEREGGHVFNPDTAPNPPKSEDDILE